MASLATAAVQAHTSAGCTSIVSHVCGITVGQSPSGKPSTNAKGKVLGVSAQFVGSEGGEGTEGGEGGAEGGASATVKEALPCCWPSGSVNVPITLGGSSAYESSRVPPFQPSIPLNLSFVTQV